MRLRPILMTSFAFILGVLPLVIATGAGAEMRQSLGTAVFFGMLGVTFFGLIFTPVFYVVVRKFARKPKRTKRRSPPPPSRRASRHQHHAEARLAAHHALIGLRRLRERIGLDHRLHAGQRAEAQRVLRIGRGPDGQPADASVR